MKKTREREKEIGREKLSGVTSQDPHKTRGGAYLCVPLCPMCLRLIALCVRGCACMLACSCVLACARVCVYASAHMYAPVWALDGRAATASCQSLTRTPGLHSCTTFRSGCCECVFMSTFVCVYCARAHLCHCLYRRP